MYLVQKIGSNDRPLHSLGKNNQKLFSDKTAAKQFIDAEMPYPNLYRGQLIYQYHYLLVFDDNGDLLQKFHGIGGGARLIDWSKVP